MILYEELHQKYIVENWNKTQCAEYFKCTQQTIKNYLRKYKIKKTPEKVKERIKLTCIDKYGTESHLKTQYFKERCKHTSLVTRGVTHHMKSLEFKEKLKKGNLEQYGYENPFQQQEKITQTNLKRYGVANPMQLNFFVEKVFNTRKKNGTINTSKIEERIFHLLCEKYTKVHRQYKCELYPGRCDFGIKDKNLFIEYQGYWAHGNEPFDENNIAHIEKLEKGKDNAVTKPLYARAINGGTVIDVTKRNMARENKLNFLEFFSLDQFLKWFNEV